MLARPRCRSRQHVRGGTASRLAIDSKAVELLLVELDAQARPVRHAGAVGFKRKGLHQKIGLMIVWTQDVGGLGCTVEFRHGTSEMQHSRRADSQLEVRTNMAGDPGRGG